MIKFIFHQQTRHSAAERPPGRQASETYCVCVSVATSNRKRSAPAEPAFCFAAGEMRFAIRRVVTVDAFAVDVAAAYRLWICVYYMGHLHLSGSLVPPRKPISHPKVLALLERSLARFALRPQKRRLLHLMDEHLSDVAPCGALQLIVSLSSSTSSLPSPGPTTGGGGATVH